MNTLIVRVNTSRRFDSLMESVLRMGLVVKEPVHHDGIKDEYILVFAEDPTTCQIIRDEKLIGYYSASKSMRVLHSLIRMEEFFAPGGYETIYIDRHQLDNRGRIHLSFLEKGKEEDVEFYP
ncbi:hypothetical protein AVT69_gp341 [Pseudomonas phage PhiPA3]|uniref:Uncharacterized protein 343 n=1 Tax=Pseudomonas phage PhiPA3 TaxID=998086 RepID=F8SJM8_BPPA3|nr:hypothetical protein AVT69_gp341 [Pseudomonas phage PhiPA3]AEH03766.1 hypothetical protein [Pseudomonas phage PhiPA3]